MKDIIRAVFLVLLLGVIGGIIAPLALFVTRLANSWTSHNTDQLLGGVLAMCGGGVVLIALMIGAGAFARLAGWKPPRREDPQPPTIEAPYQQLPPPTSLPPWGVTGGGQYQLLPPTEQDRRYSLTIDRGEDRDQPGQR